MAGYNNQMLAVVLLGLAASSCSARQLLAVNDEPLALVQGETRSIVPTLAPMLRALQLDTNLMESAVKCSEATGIADVAGSLPEVLYGAMTAFSTYGFCGLPSQKEQTDRLSYMATYAVSIHLRDMFLDEYDCKDMQGKRLQGLPTECLFGNLVEGAVAAAAVHYKGDLLCVDAVSDGKEKVKLLTLPAEWESAELSFQCDPKTKEP